MASLFYGPAMNHYRIKANWAKGETGKVLQTGARRIMYTWIRTGSIWQIIGGMSAINRSALRQTTSRVRS